MHAPRELKCKATGRRKANRIPSNEEDDTTKYRHLLGSNTLLDDATCVKSMLMMVSPTQRLGLGLVLVCRYVLPTNALFVSASHSIAQTPTQSRPVRRNQRIDTPAVVCWSKQTDSDDEDFCSVRKAINRDFVSIAVPAFLQQVAVPFADLVDSSFLSKLKPEALGGVGVARASQAAVSKLYTSALSKTTISFIASKYGASRTDESKQSKEELSSAVTTGLLLAAIVGAIQLLVFTSFAGPILNGMGIAPTSDMAPAASSFMKARAFAAPAATLWLVANGIFRGFGDTLTPLKCSILLNVVNFLLDPVMMFKFDLGAGGVAAATAVAQSVAVIPLLWILKSRFKLRIRGHWQELSDSMSQYVKAGSFIMIQTVARVAAFSYCSRQSALLGSVAASAYSVTFQIGFLITLVCESITVAVQTLLSRELADESVSLSLRRRIATHLVRTSIFSGVGLTTALSAIVYVNRFRFIRVFTKSAEVQQAALAALPAFLTTQLVKGLAFPINGVMLGGMEWRFSMIITWFANAACFATLRMGPPSVSRIWTSWSVFFAVQSLCGLFRYTRKLGGTWKKLSG